MNEASEMLLKPSLKKQPVKNDEMINRTSACPIQAAVNLAGQIWQPLRSSSLPIIQGPSSLPWLTQPWSQNLLPPLQNPQKSKRIAIFSSLT
jgi:hypothetical protein